MGAIVVMPDLGTFISFMRSAEACDVSPGIGNGAIVVWLLRASMTTTGGLPGLVPRGLRLGAGADCDACSERACGR